MRGYHYIGLDVHKKMIAYCMKRADGTIVEEGSVRATHRNVTAWAQRIGVPWIGGMEATLFTGWVYDELEPYARELHVGHPYRMRAIAGSKKKTDRLDARTLADLLRSNLFPSCYMAPREVRELRRVLRYRGLVVREGTRMRNKVAGLLMEVGAEYERDRLHGRRYFHRLLERVEDIPGSVLELLKLSRSALEMFEGNQRKLLEALREHPELRGRIERLMTIPGVGEVTALTWALEIGDPHRFSTRSKAVSYCGLCSAQHESAGKARRGPLSKQRNSHLQTVLIEAAKLAPRWNPHLAAVYQRERERGANPNRATIAVARKLVAYLLSVDKRGKEFTLRDVV